MLIFYNWIIAICVVIISTVNVYVTFCIRHKSFTKRGNISTSQELYTHRISDFFKGIFVIRQFQSFSRIEDEHNKINKNLEHNKYDYNIFNAIFEFVAGFFSISTFTISFFLGAYLVNKGIITIAIMISSIQLINNIISPMQEMIMYVNQLNGIKSVKNKVLNITKNTILKNETSKYISIDGPLNIDLRNLSYNYGENIILKNINLNFEKSKKYLIVGSSGCGKTTLLNLITKQIDTELNSIFFNGIPLNEISENQIFQCIGYMNQNIFLFNDSIKNNISMYQNDCDEDAIKSSMHNAGIYKDLNNTLIENGDNLSGGEKQRIALARVFYYNNDTLILDEPFSSLDNSTTVDICNKLLKSEKTVIMTSHDYNSQFLNYFDEIIVINKGSIIESGDFSSLMKKHGYFYNLFNLGS